MENRYNRQSRAVDVKPHSYHPCHKCHNHYGKQNMVSFIRLFIILKLLSCGVSNVIVALWWLTRWYYNGSHLRFSCESHLKTQFWSHREHCIVMSTRNVTVKSYCDLMVTETLLWNHHCVSLWKVTRWFHFLPYEEFVTI